MPVPASFNDIAADASVHDYVGDVWYQRVVRVPRGWDGQRIVLHFESATHRATVWVGSTEVVSHEGGYTPFEGDVSAQVVAGRGGAGHAMREQHLVVPDHPAGRHRGLAHGEEAAVLARLLQLRRAAPVGLAAGDSGGSPRRRHRRDRARRVDRHRRVRGRRRRPRAWTFGSSLRDADGRGGGRWSRGSGHADASPTCTGGHRATATCTTSRSSWSTATGVVDTYHQPVGVRTVEVRGSRVPRQRGAGLLQGVRQARGHRRPRQGAQRRATWCTTSSC